MITQLGDVCQLINKGEQILFILSRQNIIIVLSKPSKLRLVWRALLSVPK